MLRGYSNQRLTKIGYCAFALSLAGCMSGEALDEAEETQSVGQEIINGTAPAKGALESWGVVYLSSGCSGVLLTNRHILTANHCVRDIFTAPYNSYVPIDATLEKPPVAGQQDPVVRASNSIEHSQPYSLENLDYAILVLDAPMPVAGETNKFYRSYYTGADSSLKTKSVFCVGYGMTTLATNVGGTWTPGGNGRLTSANQTIDDVWGSGVNGTLIRKVHNGIVGAGGDSGSPCFFKDGTTWTITGPQSNCPDFDWVNFIDPAKNEFTWPEATAIRECRGAAPSAYKSLVYQNIFTDVTVRFDALPALPAGTTATGTLATTAGSFNVDVFRGQTFKAPKSGQLVTAVSNEPPRTMCPRVTTDASMASTSTLTGRCLGDGLVSVLL